MYLLVLTLIYCLLTQVLNISYSLSFGIYLVGLSISKGLLSEDIKDVFNFRETSSIYKKVGFKDSLIEFISLMIIYINSYLIDYEPFSTFEFVLTVFVFILVYRFLFWGITETFRKTLNKKDIK